jgi:MoxR-vWA-beta-propeller ternary system domain bpX4
MQHHYFFNMIKNLRNNEEVLLYNNVLEISEADAIAVIDFLREEYQQEVVDYPFTSPLYNAEAALWAAKTIYTATQLLLYRKHKEVDLTLLLPNFDKEITASEILSADLCLRFLPAILTELKLIDGEDLLISILEEILYTWHFSGINYSLALEKLNLDVVCQDQTLQQLYLNRIVAFKNLPLAKHPTFKNKIDSNLGMYAQQFWKNYELETKNNE